MGKASKMVITNVKMTNVVRNNSVYNDIIHLISDDEIRVEEINDINRCSEIGLEKSINNTEKSPKSNEPGKR